MKHRDNHYLLPLQASLSLFSQKDTRTVRLMET